LPREEVIGRSLDDFADPSLRPVISERWRTFLEQGEQKGTLQLVGADGGPRDVEYLAKRHVLPLRHLLVLRDKTSPPGDVEMGKELAKADVPGWVQDLAFFLLDGDGKVVAWYAGAERIYG
jgi:formate hydrogenlyase transcriptional activator